MACELLQPVFSDPTAFAVDIYRELQKQNLSKIYLAAPPAEIAFISNLRDKLNKRGIKVLTFEDAENFIVENYFDCSHFRVSLVYCCCFMTYKEVYSLLDTIIIDYNRLFQLHKDDTLSLFEQEVCYQSSLFVRSLKSTWSFNIFAERELHQMPTISVIDVLRNVNLDE